MEVSSMLLSHKDILTCESDMQASLSREFPYSLPAKFCVTFSILIYDKCQIPHFHAQTIFLHYNRKIMGVPVWTIDQVSFAANEPLALIC